MSRTMERTLWVGGVVLAVHVVGVGALMLVQGCGTTKPGPESVQRPQPPVMPPVVEPVAPPVVKPTPPVAKPTPPPPPETITHVVAKGDYLSAIAAKYGVTTAEIVEMNNLKDPNKISVGQKLIVPAGGVPRPVHKTAPKPKATKASGVVPVEPGGKYIVKPGDSVSVIAVRHGVTQEALKKANNLTSDRIIAGQALLIPEEGAARTGTGAPAPAEVIPPSTNLKEVPAVASAVPGAAPAAKPAAPAAFAAKPAAKPVVPTGDSSTIIHDVVAGEDLYSVSLKYAVPVDELKKANNLTGTTLEEGMRLKVPLLDQ